MDTNGVWLKLLIVFITPLLLIISMMASLNCVTSAANNHKSVQQSSSLSLFCRFNTIIALKNSTRLRECYPVGFKRRIRNSWNPRNKKSQYTLKVLPSPPPGRQNKTMAANFACDRKSCSSDNQTKFYENPPQAENSSENSSYPFILNSSNHITIKVQILPWNEFYVASNLRNCINTEVALRTVNHALRRNPPPAGITIVPILPSENLTCMERHSVMHLFSHLTSSSSNVVIGGIDDSLCRIARRIAEKHHKLLILWTCSQVDPANGQERDTVIKTETKSHVSKATFKPFAMVTPVSRQIGESVEAVLHQMKWRHVSIVAIDSVYWNVLAHSIDTYLRKEFAPSLHTVKSRPAAEDLVQLMKSIPSSVRALLVVIPLTSPILESLLRIAETEGIIKFSSVILIDPFYERENITFSTAKQFSNESSEANSSSFYELPSAIASLSMDLKRAIMLLVPSSGSSTIDYNSTGNLRIYELSKKEQIFNELNTTAKPLSMHDHLDREAQKVITTLIYDSISLVSHILRRNVGSHHLQKKRRRKYSYKPLNKSVKITSTKSELPYGLAVSDSYLGRIQAVSDSYLGRIQNNSEELADIKHIIDELKVQKRNRINRGVRRLKHIILESGSSINSTASNKINTKPSLLRLDPTKWTQFDARNGKSFVDSSGRRYFEFLLLDYDPRTDSMVPVVRVIPSVPHKGVQDIDGVIAVFQIDEIDWAFDQPILPELSYLSHSIGYAVLSAVVIISVVMASCAISVAVRKWLRQKEFSKGPYKILLNTGDIALSSQIETSVTKETAEVKDRPDLLEGGHLTVPSHSQKSERELQSFSLREADKIKAKYNGDFVHMRYFHCQGNFEVKNRTMTQLKLMHDLRHENVNGFVGLLCDQSRPGFVFEHGSRGSLEDIIKQKDIKLDWSFRLSLLTDLVRGMRYMHCSPLRVHGRLTSRNCIIDGRWVLKITDYGLSSVYDVQNINQPYRTTKELMYKAPELLRDESLMVKGTQQGDVFSFAIIMQEVLVRGEPYCMMALSYSEILVRLKKPPPMIRPSVSKGAAPPDAINIMKQCWAQLPEMRPDFNQINDLFKKLNEGRRLNIVDTMFQMLEKYSSNLEDLIKERTEQLDIEKKKTEHLLNRMLPSSVASQLKLGTAVAPEEFDEVTIYFSDIVGFTTISAYSTPFEVVDLLNDLYTAFDATIDHYNVYKVETIGDAYMVVAGVPKKIKNHAAQVATMALDLLHLSGKFRIKHLPNIPLMLRIGMHTGPCCAGVVGKTMPRYCLFGDTVNTASRMESSGSAWRIHISEATVHKLRETGGYNIEYRGRTLIKGKGLMPTFWVLGKDDFQKELPVPPDIGQAHNLDEELLRLGRQHYKTRRDSINEAALASIKTFNLNLKKQQENSMKAVSSSLHHFPLSTNLKGVKGTQLNKDSQILEQSVSDNETDEDKSQPITPIDVENNEPKSVAMPKLSLKTTDSVKLKLQSANKDDSSCTKLEEQVTEDRTPISSTKRKRSNELDTKNIVSNLNDIRHTIDEMGKNVAKQSTNKKLSKQTLLKSFDKSSTNFFHHGHNIELKNNYKKCKDCVAKLNKIKNIQQMTSCDHGKARKLTLANGMMKKCLFKVPKLTSEIISERLKKSDVKGSNNYLQDTKENGTLDQIYYKQLKKCVRNRQQCNISKIMAGSSEASSYTFSHQLLPDNKSPSPAESTLI